MWKVYFVTFVLILFFISLSSMIIIPFVTLPFSKPTEHRRQFLPSVNPSCYIVPCVFNSLSLTYAAICNIDGTIHLIPSLIYRPSPLTHPQHHPNLPSLTFVYLHLTSTPSNPIIYGPLVKLFHIVPMKPALGACSAKLSRLALVAASLLDRF